MDDCKCKCGIECCGEEMKKLVPNSVDAAVEKHVPVYEVKDVGEVNDINGHDVKILVEKN